MASKRRLRQKQCGGKIGYESSQRAAAVAAYLQAVDGRMMLPYRCRWCKRWHVGHAPKAARLEMEAR